jgi:DNA-binding MarR family transcriptional regulator
VADDRTSHESRSSVRMTPDGPVFDLERYVPALIVFIANKLTSGSSRLYRENFGIGTTEWRIMVMLVVEPDITAQRICEIIGFDKAAVSRSLKLLEQRGLTVTRLIGANRRGSRMSLSEAGHALHARIAKIALERERRLLSQLSAAEVDALVDMLNRMHGSIGLINGPIDIPEA